MGRLAILTSAAALAAVLASAALSSGAVAQPNPNTPPAQPGGSLFPPGPSAPAGQPGVMPLPPPPVIYTMEQIAVPQFTAELRDALAPVHSLQAAEEVLKVRGIPFGWRRVEVNSGALDPNLARQLAALPPHEVIIVPQAQGATMATIVQQRPAAGVAAPPSPAPRPAPSAPPKKP